MSESAGTKTVRPLWYEVSLSSSLLDGQVAFVLLMVLFIATGAAFLPNPNLLSLTTIAQLLVFSGLSLCFALVAHVTAKFAKTRSVEATIDHAFQAILAPSNLARALPTVLLVGVFMFTFPSFKSQIPAFNPFSWDPAIASFDRMLHFGHAPWELVADVTGYGTFTSRIDHFYYLWFPVIFTTTAAVALIPGDSDVRHRFLLSFILSWIVIGCVLAVAFSSVGPIYFDRLNGGTSEFTALVAQLEAVNAKTALQTLVVRDQLWQAYTAPSNEVISGISAMPSMHNAVCVLMFLAARHAGKLLAWAAGLFALAIFVGSVHLGWHYAADGYLSALIVACIWKFTGWHVKQTANPV